jgi:hypothetical protein
LATMGSGGTYPHNVDTRGRRCPPAPRKPGRRRPRLSLDPAPCGGTPAPLPAGMLRHRLAHASSHAA